MAENRKLGLIIGVLYIIGTISGILSVVLTGSVSNTYDYYTQIVLKDNQYILGTLFILLMGFSLAFVPIIIYPVLKKQNKTLALGYVVFRGALETVTYIVGFLLMIILLEIGRNHINEIVNVGSIIFKFRELSTLVMNFVFSIGALIFYFALYQSKLIPHWLSLWGIIAIIIHFLTGILILFGLQTEESTIINIMNFPIFSQEMVMAVWLIIKGFDYKINENK